MQAAAQSAPKRSKTGSGALSVMGCVAAKGGNRMRPVASKMDIVLKAAVCLAAVLSLLG